MKKAIFIVIFAVLRFAAFAQKEPCYAGVYVTGDDFIHNRLSYIINTNEPGYHLRFPPIADWKLEIKMITPDSVYKFPQGTIYGYSECGKQYRYSPGGRLYAIEDFYKVEEKGSLIIYTSVFNGGSEHYYSSGFDAPIRRLNIQNLKRDFADQPAFVHAAKNIRKRGIHGGLAAVDNDGLYIINRLYEQTIRK